MRVKHELNPPAMSEADLLALEEQHDRMVAGAKRIRYHLLNCENGDSKTFEAFEELLKYIGIHADVVQPEPVVEQPLDFVLDQNSPDPF